MKEGCKVTRKSSCIREKSASYEFHLLEKGGGRRVVDQVVTEYSFLFVGGHEKGGGGPRPREEGGETCSSVEGTQTQQLFCRTAVKEPPARSLTERRAIPSCRLLRVRRIHRSRSPLFTKEGRRGGGEGASSSKTSPGKGKGG